MERLTIEQIKERKLQINPNQNHILTNGILFEMEVSKFWKCKVFFRVDTYEGKSEVVDYLCYLDNEKEIFIYVLYNEHQKRYFFFTDIKDLKNISAYADTDERKKFLSERPKNVGTLSTEKIRQWINYEDLIYQNLKSLNDSNKEKIDKFLASLPDDVHWYSKNKSGKIERGIFEFYFEISNTFVSERIELRLWNCGLNSNLESFEKITKNADFSKY